MRAAVRVSSVISILVTTSTVGPQNNGCRDLSKTVFNYKRERTYYRTLCAVGRDVYSSMRVSAETSTYAASIYLRIPKANAAGYEN